MSAKHTPGPWKIERGYSTIIKSIGPCVPDEYAGSAWLEVSEEDARLIAAAPELLAALQAVLHDCENLDMVESNEPGRDIGPFEMAIAAIAKAIG